MVFSSVAAYLDPSNWQQQQTQEVAGSSSLDPLLPPPSHPAPPPPPQLPHGGGIGSIRPGSMAERARLANIRMPEAALKCPRCESTNTKFCYFNNYSLTQPRHFCKTCRRYWTRGGALRNVPVGGGCRRNRRSKSASSKSPESSDRGSATAVSTSHGAANTLGLTPQLPPLRLVSPLSQLSDNFTSDMGLNYSGISADEMNFHAANINVLGGGGIEPWRSQQFSFFGGLDPSAQGIYQFQGGELGHQVRPKLPSSLLTSVKMEENPEMSLSKQVQGGMAPTNDQWNTSAAWTDF